MTIKTQTQIDRVSKNVKANMFSQMMLYASKLSVGVAEPPTAYMQSNLIWAMDSEYATLEQRGLFADTASGLKMDIVSSDGLGVPNLFEPNL